MLLLLLTLMAASEKDSVTSSQVVVIHDAVIHTVNEAAPLAQAFAFKDGRILAVGTTENVIDAYPDAERVDAGGMAIIPGFIDAHAHLLEQGTAMLRANLVGARSIDEVLERLVHFERSLPQDGWLVGRGWDQNHWPDQAFPTRYDLDHAFPTRPVWLIRIDGHAAWANTAALKQAGVEWSSVRDPDGGRILRDSAGEPTGVFVDTAMRLIGQHQPDLSSEQQEHALLVAIAEANRYGLTGVHDAGLDLNTIDLFERMIERGQLNLRIYGMIGGAGRTFDHFCDGGPLLNFGERLTVRSLKLYIDGALGSRGAALLEDYEDDPGNQGLLLMARDEYEGVVRRALQCGLQVNTHAIGDRGNRIVLDTYEKLQIQEPGNPGRHRIEHAQIVALEDIPRFSRLGVIASVQPIHATSDMYWAEERVGLERIRGGYAWRSFLDSGAVVAAGSDFPVEPVNPLLGFFSAIARQDTTFWPEDGWHPEQALTREEALRAFTLDAAYAGFGEGEVGSIEVGKRADFVILSHDIMSIPKEQILETEVIATYLGGQKVYPASE